MRHCRVALALVFALVALSAAASTSTDIPLRNWTPPHGRSPLSDASGFVVSFMPVTPCRLADTRGNGFTGAYGTPQLVGGGAPRSFPIPSNPTCTGIPSGAAAFSLNFTVVAPPGTPPGGYLTVFPTGGVQPVVSTLNFTANSILANAAVVPAGTSGGVSVFVNFSTDLIIDINGYYIGSGGGTPMNPGIFAGFTGDFSGGGLFYARNDNTTSASTGTAGVRGVIVTNQNNPAGVWGQAAGASGANFGVKGTNTSTTDGAAGVYGQASGATGRTYGVIGRTSSTSGQSYGVVGIAGGATWIPVNIFQAGGRFVGTNSSSYGAQGEGLTGGFIGYRVDGTGVFQTYGIVGYAGTDGLYTPQHLTAVGGKSFAEPHPSDASKVIKYVCPEGPESGTYFRGRGRFANRTAIIEVPEHFRIVTEEEGLTVQITPIGRAASVGVVRIGLDQIEVESTRDVEFSYLVQGVRKAYKDWQPVQSATATENPYFIPQSASQKMEGFWPEEIRQRLISNGTYLPDGTVNMGTAEKLGWAQRWRDEEKARQEAAARVQAEPAPGPGNNSSDGN